MLILGCFAVPSFASSNNYFADFEAFSEPYAYTVNFISSGTYVYEGTVFLAVPSLDPLPPGDYVVRGSMSGVTKSEDSAPDFLTVSLFYFDSVEDNEPTVVMWDYDTPFTVSDGEYVIVTAQSLNSLPVLEVYSESEHSIYSSLYIMLSDAFYGEGAELTGWQELTLTLLCTAALVFAFAFPFLVVWFVIRLLVSR